jgi:heme-degrading monooxygenase HmoA
MSTLSIESGSVLANLAARYWAGWEHYARTYEAELDQRAEFPTPTVEAAAQPAVEQDAPIVRVWRGRVRAADADAFHRYLQRRGAPSYRNAGGNLGVTILRRALGATVEFMLISQWASRAAVIGYAGNDADEPLHFAGTERYLLPEGEGVEHFEVLPEALPRYASVRY